MSDAGAYGAQTAANGALQYNAKGTTFGGAAKGTASQPNVFCKGADPLTNNHGS